jgi:hypothetical protein
VPDLSVRARARRLSDLPGQWDGSATASARAVGAAAATPRRAERHPVTVTGLRPIETRYKGYRFRSRLEARWAVFFDTLGWPWDYEVEGYDLGQAGFYLPDFVLYGSMFVEIKPPGRVGDAYDKCRALHEQSGRSVLLLKGNPRDHLGIYLSRDPEDDSPGVAAAALYQCRKCPAMGIGYVLVTGNARCDGDRVLNDDFDGWQAWCEPGCRGETILRGTEYIAAVNAALGARFEHGETP